MTQAASIQRTNLLIILSNNHAKNSSFKLVLIMLSLFFHPYEIEGAYMWCDLAKSVWSRTYDIFSCLFDWSAHLLRYILLQTPPESDQWFQSYEQLTDSQNNRKQKKLIPLSGYISQTINAPDIWLIPLDCNTYLNMASSGSSKIRFTDKMFSLIISHCYQK